MSVDYKVNLSDVRRILDRKIAFAGNLNPVSVMQKETVEGVAAASRDAINKAGTGGGFILMPGCDIPPSVPLENVKIMVETARAFPLLQKEF
jgi:uroporphyrinogen decarboxylase